MEKPWWFPVLVNDAYIARLRKDYPDVTKNLDNAEVHDKYCDGRKYAVLWDNVGDAYTEYEKLADAYLGLLEYLESKKNND